MSMGIGGIGRMAGAGMQGMGGGQQVGQPGGMDQQKLLEMLMKMLGGAGGAQGGGGSQGGGAAGGDQADILEKMKQMMRGQQGMQAMMPGSDSGRNISFG